MESNSEKSEGMKPRIQSLSQLFTDTNLVTEAIRAAVREAVLEHKRAGNPVAIWRDGKSVVIPPEEITIPAENENAASSTTASSSPSVRS